MKLIDLLNGTYWQFNLTAIIIAAILVIFQLRTGKSLPLGKKLLFYSGVVLMLLVTITPLAFVAHGYLFSIHMVEHIVLLLIVPPMLLAGANPKLFEKLKNSRFHKTGNILLAAPVTWILGMGAMYFWHIPAVFEAMKTSAGLHAIHIISLVAIGLVFIWPVYAPVNWKRLGPLQSVLYLFIACTGCTVLGIMITFAPESVYIPYMPGQDAAIWDLFRGSYGITGAIDQQAAGLIMWVPACIVYVTNIMLILAGYFNQPDHETI